MIDTLRSNQRLLGKRLCGVVCLLSLTGVGFAAAAHSPTALYLGPLFVMSTSGTLLSGAELEPKWIVQAPLQPHPHTAAITMGVHAQAWPHRELLITRALELNVRHIPENVLESRPTCFDTSRETAGIAFDQSALPETSGFSAEEITPVAEPGTWIAAALATIGVAFSRRRAVATLLRRIRNMKRSVQPFEHLSCSDSTCFPQANTASQMLH